MLTSQVQYWNLQETKRHNWETERAAYAQAEAAKKQADVAERNAEINAANAATNARNADTNLFNAQANARLGWANYDVANRLADSNIDLNLSSATRNYAETGLTSEKTNTQKQYTEQEKVKTTFQPREIFAQLDYTKAQTAESNARKTQGWINTISNAVKAVGSLFSPLN